MGGPTSHIITLIAITFFQRFAHNTVILLLLMERMQCDLKQLLINPSGPQPYHNRRFTIVTFLQDLRYVTNVIFQ